MSRLWTTTNGRTECEDRARILNQNSQLMFLRCHPIEPFLVEIRAPVRPNLQTFDLLIFLGVKF